MLKQYSLRYTHTYDASLRTVSKFNSSFYILYSIVYFIYFIIQSGFCMGGCQNKPVKAVKEYNKNNQPLHKDASFQTLESNRLQQMYQQYTNNTDKQSFNSIQSIEFKRLIVSLPDKVLQIQLDHKAEELKNPILHSAVLQDNLSFQNWPQTFTCQYERIFYPFNTDNQFIFKQNQIAAIQQFVKEGALRNKRIRASGMRYSSSKIFSDPSQLIVSFYPSDVSVGCTHLVKFYAKKMADLQNDLKDEKNNCEHLCMIRYQGYDESTQKHQVKIGASVSNEQLRKWCIKNGFQLKSNVTPIEINFIGALSTCSHGSGIETQTLADYVSQIQFIDYQGKRHVISKKEHPHLIGSAAGSLGLLGLIIFVTIEMDELQIVKTEPRKMYKDDVIPFPEVLKNSRQFLKKRAAQRRVHNKSDNLSWLEKVQNFKSAINKTYCEWFYFPIQGAHIYENVWTVYSDKTEKSLKQISDSKGQFLDRFPPSMETVASKIGLSIYNNFDHDEESKDYEKSLLGAQLIKAPIFFLPQKEIFLNYPDAQHFQRGIQRMKVRSFQMLINIPYILTNGIQQINYDLIQEIWWRSMEIVEKNKKVINVSMEMRVFKGSRATLAPTFNYDYVCSIQITRAMIPQQKVDNWISVCGQLFNQWKQLKDQYKKPLTIRPHWGKQWAQFPLVRKSILSDSKLKQNFRLFWQDYQQIAKLKGFDAQKNLATFSNDVYRQLFNYSMFSISVMDPINT